MKFTTALTAFLLCFSIVNAQSKEAEKYKKESEEIRKQVWAWNDPKFKVTTIPAEYANASKVIIARHTELTAESKSKLAFYGLAFGGKKELTINEVAREIIKINDKKAVEEYSELSFTQLEKTSGFFTKDKRTTYIGLRIIKPNGNMKEINGDEVVLTKDESAEKKAKLAIPDLAPGDVLDYFIATEQALTNTMGNSAYNIFLFDDAPVMNISFHAQLGKKYAIEYKSYNGAPELKVSKNDDKEIIVDVEEKNIKPFETSLWVAAAKQLPFIRMYISLGYKGPGAKLYDYSKPGEVVKNVGGQIAMDDKAAELSSSYATKYWMKAARFQFEEIEKKAKSRAKDMGISYSSLSDDEKSALLYYSFRFDYFLNFDIDNLNETLSGGRRDFNGFAFIFFSILKAASLDPAILVSEAKNGYRLNDAMNPDDLVDAAYLPSSKKFIGLYTIYDVPFSTPLAMDGVKNTRSVTFDHPAIMGANKTRSLSNVVNGMKVPEVESSKNMRSEKLKISVLADKSLLNIDRSTIVKGYYKSDVQKELVLYEDFYENERKYFGEKKSLIEELEDGKKSKKYVDEVKNAFAEARKKQKDAFIADAKNWFEQEVTDLTDYKIENLGVRHTAPDFIYNSSFNLGGLVKKGGNNIIIEVGKLQGTPLTVKEDQRKRTIDVYQPFARSIEYDIELDIPEGYTAEGVAALNKNVENETGFFKVEATGTDKLVTIKVRKHYLHSYEPAANFPKLMEFMDASEAWTNAKLLFKKK